MSRELVVRPEAERDITDAAVWYERQSHGLGWDFTRVADACLAEIVRNPSRFPEVRGRARRALLRRFPFAVFFVVDDTSIRVIAVLHMRQNPERWQRRLRADR